jgi:cytochrome P450
MSSLMISSMTGEMFYPTLLAIISATCVLLLLCVGRASEWREPKNLPPRSSTSAWYNLRKRLSHKGSARVTLLMEASEEISKQKSGGSEFGTCFRIQTIPLFPDPIFITDYKLARLVLLGDAKLGIKESIKKNTLTSMNLGNRRISNIFTSPSSCVNRSKARKFLAPAFSATNLQETTPYLYKNLDAAFSILRNCSLRGEIVDMKEVVLAILLQTLTGSAFNMEFQCAILNPRACKDHSEDQDNTYIVDGDKFTAQIETVLKERALQLVISFRKHMWWNSKVRECDQTCKEMGETSQRILDHYRATHQLNSAASEDAKDSRKCKIIDRLIQHSYPEPSDEHRISDMLILLLAGHETTAYTLCFLLYALARHPEAQAKLHAELDAAFGPVKDAASKPTSGEANKVTYLQWCIYESMRLWPTAGAGSARTLESDIPYNGMILPKGKVVIASFYCIFRQPWIDRAEEFVPERWCESNPQHRDLRDMFMPFSLGGRNCVGQNMAQMQLKLLSASLVHNFTFEMEEKDAEIQLDCFFTIKPESLKMKVTVR